MKQLALILTLFVSIIGYSQNQSIRDSIIGKYFCHVTFYFNQNTTYDTDTINPFLDPADTIAFTIDDGKYCCWDLHMVLINDSVFTATNAISDGKFYAPDSLYYNYNCLSPLGCFYYFNCHKVSSSVIVEINESEFSDNLFNISPNPANDKLIIASKIFLRNTIVQLHNIVGEIVFENNFQNINTLVEIDVSRIKNGIYFLSLIQGQQVNIFKM
ncbi:MAG TPA: T9SS type A sorting domain-containing protein [Bacteroidales bacterium]|nr:T9SS type A sorting domain-containing protein [Bacteroidales bacterium]